MERYSLIVVADETSPIRRIDVPKLWVRRAFGGAIALALLLLIGLVDYVHVRIQHGELGRLRVENAAQQARIDSFDQTVSGVESSLERIRELERKVRIIANLPGSVASGGDVVEVGADGRDLSSLAGGGVDVEPVPLPETPLGAAREEPNAPVVAPDAADDRVGALRSAVRRLGHVADQRQLSLEELVEQLEAKADRLASSPAIWPTKGWLTSRFGTRISPFTGRRQFHAGVDIAGAQGTEVIATARGSVIFAGLKGPMGRTVIIDHGYGVRTYYGHNQELRVKKGDRVERGQVIASLGNTGRSTGPHLHYSVQVKGKAVNPLDYIFD